MSLERLFEDRKVRKYIRDGINEAKELGKGTCDCCDEVGPLMFGFGKHLCESCITKAFDMADDYSTEYHSISDKEVIKFIQEGYVIPDMAKLQADANGNFKGSIPDLMSTYGIHVDKKDWDSRLDSGYIYIKSSDVRSGKTRLNKFLIDYDCEFDTARSAASLVADADGTMAPLKVKGGTVLNATNTSASGKVNVPNTATKASTSKATKQSSSSSVSTIRTGYVTGNIDKFSIQLGGSEEIDAELIDTNGVKSFNLTYDGTTTNITVNDKDAYTDIKKAVEAVKAKLVENPSLMFGAFKGVSSGQFEINKYPLYKFALDEFSFASELSLAVVYNGKTHPKNRVPVTGKALKNVAVMNSELTKYMDALIAKKYPALTSGKNRFKTSIGVAVFELLSIEDMDRDIIRVNVDLANTSFEARVDGTRMKDAASSADAFSEIIMNAVYPTQSIYNFKGGRLVADMETGKDKYSLKDVDLGNGRKFDVYADFLYKELYSKGDIAFGISVIDEHTGEEQPKKQQVYVVRKAGESINNILRVEGCKIWKEFFEDSNAIDKMTDKALAKMKSSGKKAALMSKIADIFVKKLRKGRIYSVSPETFEMEYEFDMEVNKDGKPIKVNFTMTDPDAEYASDSRGLASITSLDKAIPWIKFVKADAVMKDGPKVYYTVTDMQEFADFINLYILEDAIFEAYGLVRVNESTNRKTFYV